MRIRRDDLVQLITGNGAGAQGKVVRVLLETDKVIVQNQNYVWKHVRRTQKNPQGGRLQKEAPIHVSNVRLVCPACSEPTRIRLRKNDQGKRVRVCRKCNEEIG